MQDGIDPAACSWLQKDTNIADPNGPNSGANATPDAIQPHSIRVAQAIGQTAAVTGPADAVLKLNKLNINVNNNLFAISKTPLVIQQQ